MKGKSSILNNYKTFTAMFGLANTKKTVSEKCCQKHYLVNSNFILYDRV